MRDRNNSNIFLLSLPIFVELLLQLLVGNVDQFMLSQYSQNSVAAIGNSNQFINIIIIVLNVLSMATTVLLTQYIGAGNTSKVSEVCTVSTVLLGGISLLMMVVSMVFARPLFTWLNVPADVIDEACLYTQIIGSFLLVQGLYMNFAAIIRSFSLLKEVMLAAIVMNVLNIFGNAILINGYFGFPRLGIVGAAISTNFSKVVGLIIVGLIFYKRVQAEISPSYLKPFPFATLKRLLYVGLPSGGENFSYNLSQMVIMMFVNLFGTAVITTKVYCTMIASISYVYSMAISQATQIVLGYLLGAGKKDAVPKKIYGTILISLLVSFSITLLAFLNSDVVFGIFTDDPQVLELAHKIMFIDLFLEAGRSVNIMMTRGLVATGDVKPPLIAGLICMWSLTVGMSYVLGVYFNMGLVGIWIAMALDECVRAVVFLIRFQSGAWRKKHVI